MAATKTSAWVIPSVGAVDNLRLDEEYDLPALQPGQVRVNIKAIGLNFADIFSCLGLYSATPPVPFVPGLEFSGVVTEVHPEGHGTGSIPVRGDRVMGVTR